MRYVLVDDEYSRLSSDRGVEAKRKALSWRSGIESHARGGGLSAHGHPLFVGRGKIIDISGSGGEDHDKNYAGRTEKEASTNERDVNVFTSGTVLQMLKLPDGVEGLQRARAPCALAFNGVHLFHEAGIWNRRYGRGRRSLRRHPVSQFSTSSWFHPPESVRRHQQIAAQRASAVAAAHAQQRDKQSVLEDVRRWLKNVWNI